MKLCIGINCRRSARELKIYRHSRSRFDSSKFKRFNLIYRLVDLTNREKLKIFSPIYTLHCLDNQLESKQIANGVIVDSVIGTVNKTCLHEIESSLSDGCY